jgi:hypothetical protein
VSLRDEHRQHLDSLGADDQVDHVGALEEPASLLLRHASRDRDDGSLAADPFEALEIPQPRVQLVLGLLSNAAGVDDHHVGIRLVAGPVVSRRLEKPRHPLRVVDVHLAAVGLDEVLH